MTERHNQIPLPSDFVGMKHFSDEKQRWHGVICLKMILSLKVDKRFTGVKLGEKRIEQLAADIVKNAEKGDDFSILTKTGHRITQSEIFIRSKVQIDSEGKTVQRDKAWSELIAFFNVLATSGAVEQ